MHRCASLVVVGILASASLAHAAPVAVATCGDSKLELAAGTGGGAPTLRGTVVAAGGRWSFTANVGLVRLGRTTRTITVEDLKAVEPPKSGKVPAGLFIDLLLDGKQVQLRHSAEGEADVAYAADLAKCSFDNDAALAALVPAASEPAGCAPAIVRDTYRARIAQAAKLGDADADREAKALCDDHQDTIAARGQLEQALSDRAASDRRKARGPALMRSEDARIQAWNRIDGCLAADPAKALGIAALHDAEAKTRACYRQIAAKP